MGVQKKGVVTDNSLRISFFQLACFMYAYFEQSSAVLALVPLYKCLLHHHHM